MQENNYYNADKDKINYLTSKIKLAKKNWETVFTYFLTPEEQLIATSIARQEDVHIGFKGGKTDYERAVAVFSNHEEENIDFPVAILRITIRKTFETLTHRDYLGALLSLGIKREMLGDINIFEDGAEIYLTNEIADFVLYNLEKIRHTGFSSELISIESARDKIQNFKVYTANVSSLRLDCMIGAIVKISRNEAQEAIKKGDVKLNYLQVFDISKKLNPGDLISIKGHGRYIFKDVLNTTKSDRLVVEINKYL